MEIQSYNAELALANLMFMRIFNNIRIERQTKEGTKEIKVNCVFDQRSRIVKNWENAEKRGNIKLPMIAISRTGYVRNPDRLNNLHNEVKYEESSKKRNYNLLTPIPIDISYDVCLVSKTPSDIDQIASNFMVFFNSDIYVSCIHPKYEGIKMNNQIIMSDSITEEHPNEIDSSADDLITTTFQFTFKTYLFGGNQQAKLVPKYVLSSYLSTFVEKTISVLNYDEVGQFHLTNPNEKIFVELTANVTKEVSAYVPSPNISDQVYDGFTPIIHNIDVGFYAIPRLKSNYNLAMNDIDNMNDSWIGVDRICWKIDEKSTNVHPYAVYSNTYDERMKYIYGDEYTAYNKTI